MENINIDIMKNAAEKLACELIQEKRNKIMENALDQLALSIWIMEDEITLSKYK